MTVCSKPNGNTMQGLCNLAGNVSEWVQDTWNENYDGAPADGSALEITGRDTRTLRGVDFRSTVDDGVYVTRRSYNAVEGQPIGTGFRCAR